MRAFSFGLLAAALIAPLSAQFTPQELEEREKWERFLLEARVLSTHQLPAKSRAVPAARVLDLEHESICCKGLWKNPVVRVGGHLDCWRFEIAAYRLDKLLELSMIPPTVERRIRNNPGCCQLMPTNCVDLRTRHQQEIEPPGHRVIHLNRAVYLQRAFDNLIGHQNRHASDILYTDDWRIILIGHSCAFPSSRLSTRRLIYDERSRGGPKLMKYLPRSFVENLKRLTYSSIQEAVGEYLTDKEIKAVLTRRDLIMDWLAKRIDKVGEGQVLY